MNAHSFVNACRIILNIDKDVLEDASVIRPHQVGGCDWDRLNRDPLGFIIRLPDERMERLWGLIEQRQPKPATGAVAETLIRIKDRLTDREERDAINEAVAALYAREVVSN